MFCRDYYIAKRLGELGVARAFNFRWNTPDPVQYAANPYKGVMHTSDLFFLFNGNVASIRALSPC
jgi:hypothetical protein